jgi:mannose-6-phosphate isomerase-like protein (cupin superfamily)
VNAPGARVIDQEITVTIKDIGPQPQSFDLEKATLENDNYRAVAWSGKYLQLTLMSIRPGDDIGLEVHPETDQFLRLDGGRGRVQMGPAEDQLDFDQEVEDGWAMLVPAGSWHNVTNIGDEPIHLYAVYAPVHHAAGAVQATAEDAERDEESGADEPPEWSVQPDEHAPDEHA